MVFLLLITLLFSAIICLVGASFDSNGNHIDEGFNTVIGVFEMAVGNVAEPNYSFWKIMEKQQPDSWLATILIRIVWMVWFLI